MIQLLVRNVLRFGFKRFIYPNITLGNFSRQCFATNAKDIGTLYLIFAVFSGLLSDLLVLLNIFIFKFFLLYLKIINIFRLNNVNNFVISGSGLNNKTKPETPEKSSEHSNDQLRVESEPKGSGEEDNKHSSLTTSPRKPTTNLKTDKRQKINPKPVLHPYKEYKILDPFNNKHQIAVASKKAIGVYVFQNVITKDCYVGSGGAITSDLYSRVCSYFRPYNLKTGKRKVLKYFNTNGFANIELKLFVMSPTSSWLERLELEQYFINTLKPNLNVALKAGGYYGIHHPMSKASRIKLRKERGHSIYVYDLHNLSNYLSADQVPMNLVPYFNPVLIFISDSKKFLIENIKISAKSLKNCLETNSVYLDRFFFSSTMLSVTQFFEIIKRKNIAFTPKAARLNVIDANLLSLDKLSALILLIKSRGGLKRKQTVSKKVLAENLINPSKTQVFNSILDTSNGLSIDRPKVRYYLNSGTIFKKTWRFSFL
jgi:hypothetical protein